MASGLFIAAIAMVIVILSAYFVPRMDLWQLTMVGLILSLALVAGSIPQLIPFAYYSRFLLAALLVAITIRMPKSQVSQPRARHLFYALWACIAVAAASIVWSFSPAETIAQTVLLGLLVALLQATVNRRWITVEDVAKDLRVAFWSAAAIIVSGFFLGLAGADLAVGFGGRVTGLFSNANMLGYLSVLIAALGWALWLHYRRSIYAIAVILLICAAVASGSRTAIIALAVAVVWIWLTIPIWWKLVSGWLLLTVSGFFAALFTFSAENSLDLSDGPFSRFSADDDPTSFNGRTEIWDLAADIAIDTITGVGFAVGPTYLAESGDWRASLMGLTSVHNSYFQWFLETGFIGILPLATLLVFVLFLLAVPKYSSLARGLTVVAIVGLTVQFTESMIFGTGQMYPWVFWMCIAALAACRDTNSSLNPFQSFDHEATEIHASHSD